MPKLPTLDPIKRFNEASSAVRSQEDDLSRRALRELVETRPNYVMSRTEDQLKAAVEVRVNELREELGDDAAQPPKTLFNFPTVATGASLKDAAIGAVKAPFEMGERIVGTPLSLLSEHNRPDDLFDATDMTAIRDIATTGRANLGDVGDTAQALGPAILSAIPQLKPLRLGPRIGKNIQGATAATVGALGIGASREVLENAERMIAASEGLMPTIDALRKGAKDTSVEAMTMRGIGEAVLEAGVAGSTFAPQAARMGLAKFLGVSTEEADIMVREAAQFGIDFAVRDISRIGFVRKMSDILGRFPSANTIFTEGTDRAARQASKAINDVLGDMAPTLGAIIEATSGNSQSREILKASLRGFNRTESAVITFKEEANKRYKAFFAQAESGPLPAWVGTPNTRAKAAVERKKLREGIKVKKKVDTGLVDKAGAKIKRDALVRKKLKGDRLEVDEFLSNLINADEAPTVSEFVNTTRELRELIDKFGPNSTLGRQLVELKVMMEKDFSGNLVGPPSLIELKKNADDYYKNGMKMFSGQAARSIKRIDRTFGKVAVRELTEDEVLRQGGAISPEEFTDTMFDSQRRAVIKNLHDIMSFGDKAVGKERFKESYGVWLENQFRDATSTPKGGNVALTDTDKLRKNLGLDNISSKKFRANEEAFRLAGGDIRDLSKLLGVLDRQFEFGIPDVSTLITRRILIGGIGSGLRTFAPLADKDSAANVGAIVSAISKSAAFYIASRGISKRVADPRWLKAYRTLLDPDAGNKIRLAAARRLLILDESFLVFGELTGIQPGEALKQATGFVGDRQRSLREQEPLVEGTSIDAPLPLGAGVR